MIRQRVTRDGPAANEYFGHPGGKIVLDAPGALARLAEEKRLPTTLRPVPR